MKLTYKGIAKLLGYTVKAHGLDYYWYESGREEHDDCVHNRHKTEEEAYKACCIDCGLVEKEQNE